MANLCEYGMKNGSSVPTRLSSERIAALNDADQHDDNRHGQEDVNEASERVRRDDPEQPQDEKDDDDC